MAAPLIDNIVSLSFLTSDSRAAKVGVNTAAYLADNTSATTGTLYTTAAAVDADSDLTSQEKADIKAVLAEGVGVAGVRLGCYDSGSAEDPSDALDALVTAGHLPGWDYGIAIVDDRADAAIAAAATWCHANARGRMLVAGQLATSSILSGTVPATTAASAGADLTVIAYTDKDTSSDHCALVGNILSYDTTQQRPGWGIAQPLGLIAYTTELTKAQIDSASDTTADGGASCIVHAPLYPNSSRRFTYQGNTIGGTRAEIEWGVIVLQMRLLQAFGLWIESRTSLQLPIRTTGGDADAAQTVGDDVFRAAARTGYLVTGVAADPATGRPSLPDGFSTTVTFSGSDLQYSAWVAYPSDERNIAGTIRGVVT